MSDATNTIFDENSQERPLGLFSGTTSKRKNAAVDSLTKSNSRNADTKDDAQHMKKLRNGLLVLAGTNSIVNHHNRKVYNKFTKDIGNLEDKIRSEKSAPGASGVHGRSIAEIYAEDRLKEQKKKFEKFQKKHPNLQRPQSMSNRIKGSVHTLFSGIKEATRAQSMKGVAQAQGGSDTRAMAAAAAAGYIPGAEISTQSDDYSL